MHIKPERIAIDECECIDVELGLPVRLMTSIKTWSVAVKAFPPVPASLMQMSE